MHGQTQIKLLNFTVAVGGGHCNCSPRTTKNVTTSPRVRHKGHSGATPNELCYRHRKCCKRTDRQTDTCVISPYKHLTALRSLLTG